MWWSKEEEEVLERMIKAGKTREEVRKVLVDRDDDALDRKAKKMDLSFDRPKIDYEQFKKIMKEELTETCL